MKPVLSFQLYKWPFACCAFMVLLSKTAWLKVKTRPKQLLGSLPLVIALPDVSKRLVCGIVSDDSGKVL
jgi:hypothetical protein